MHARGRPGLRVVGLAMIAAATVWLLPGPAGAQTSPPGAPQSGEAVPPPDAPPPPPDYVPPPPPPDEPEPPGAAGPDASGTPGAAPAPDYGAADQSPPDYSQAPVDAAPPSPSLGGPPLEVGEAYHTRFSGTVREPGPGGQVTVIDVNGVVGSIVDLRNLVEPALGQHLLDEPQRAPATAADAGQIFGIAIDDAPGPNIFVTATSAFGLHLAPGTSDWMRGMWGPEGGPGTVYRLPPDTGYVPEFFAEITLDGRRNTGPALGNVAYDRWNRQLYVSDLETGMIHRLSADDGTDLGRYDHGTEGRPGFVDAWTGASLSLPPVAFDPSTAARVASCAAGPFERHPECWNYADFRRRVWGLAVRRDDARGEVRLHYAVWGSEAFGNPAWNGAGDDRRNSVWSVRIGDNGQFDLSSVRREFILPSFFPDGPEAVAMAGNSRPVSDIEFAHCGPQGAMLLSERGGVRNLGLDAEEPFASPHESRVLRYEIGADGVWRPAGRYDVGFYERQEHGAPRLRASGGGGCDFGFGYRDDGTIDPARPNAFVWMTGDNLCSPRGACLTPQTGAFDDTSWVDGLQGTPADLAQDVLPEAALSPPPSGPATPPDGPAASYMIDSDINLDPAGNPADVGIDRNEATYSGDVDLFERCAAVDTGVLTPPDFAVPLPPPPVHLRDMTHMRDASPMHNVNRSWHERRWSWHDRDQSWHYRNRSWHDRDRSWHWRAGSWHSRDRSWHSRERSWHWRDRSWHWRNGSWHDRGRSWHSRDLSWHWKAQSWHAKPRSWHWKNSSWHDKRQSWHSRDRSWHGKDRSWHGKDRSWHDRDRSWHNRDRSWHDRQESLHGVHDTRRSRDQQHARQRSLDQHHARQRSLDQQHSRERSRHRDGDGVHSRARSQQKPDGGAQHSRAQSQKRDDGAVHSRARSQQKPDGGAQHSRTQSQKRDGGAVHSRAASQRKPDGGAKHARAQSQKRDGGAVHSRTASQRKPDGGAKHARAQSQQRDGAGTHGRSVSKQKQDGGAKHARAQSQQRQGAGAHSRSQSKPKQDGGAKHLRAQSQQQHQQQPHQQRQQHQQQRHDDGPPVHKRRQSQQEQR